MPIGSTVADSRPSVRSMAQIPSSPVVRALRASIHAQGLVQVPHGAGCRAEEPIHLGREYMSRTAAASDSRQWRNDSRVVAGGASDVLVAIGTSNQRPGTRPFGHRPISSRPA